MPNAGQRTQQAPKDMTPNPYQNGRYLKDNPTWHEEDSPWKAAQVLRMLEKNGLKPRTVTEVGCGAGGILLRMSDRLGPGVKFTGYEISPQAFRLCLPKTRPGLTFHQHDVMEEPRHPRFDLAMAIDVFEHVEDYYGFLRKFRGLAKHKLFHIPLDLSVQTLMRVSPILDERRRLGHLHYFTRETALETLKDTGYQVIDSFYTAGQMQLPNLTWKAELLKFPRGILFSLSPHLAVRILGGFSLMVLCE